MLLLALFPTFGRRVVVQYSWPRGGCRCSRFFDESVKEVVNWLAHPRPFERTVLIPQWRIQTFKPRHQPTPVGTHPPGALLQTSQRAHQVWKRVGIRLIGVLQRCTRAGSKIGISEETHEKPWGWLVGLPGRQKQLLWRLAAIHQGTEQPKPPAKPIQPLFDLQWQICPTPSSVCSTHRE